MEDFTGLNQGRVDQLEDPGKITPEFYTWEVDPETGRRTFGKYIEGSPVYPSPKYIWIVDPETGHRKLGPYIGPPDIGPTEEQLKETAPNRGKGYVTRRNALGITAIAALITGVSIGAKRTILRDSSGEHEPDDQSSNNDE